jgi:hypothetical protein
MNKPPADDDMVVSVIEIEAMDGADWEHDQDTLTTTQPKLAELVRRSASEAAPTSPRQAQRAAAGLKPQPPSTRNAALLSNGSASRPQATPVPIAPQPAFVAPPQRIEVPQPQPGLNTDPSLRSAADRSGSDPSASEPSPAAPGSVALRHSSLALFAESRSLRVASAIVGSIIVVVVIVMLVRSGGSSTSTPTDDSTPVAAERAPKPAAPTAIPAASKPAPVKPVATKPKPKPASKIQQRPATAVVTAKPPAAKPPAAKPPAAKPPARPAKRRTAASTKRVAVVDRAPTEPSPPPDDGASLEKARGRYAEGNQHLFAGDPAGAIEAYQQALATDPAFVAGYRGLGLAYAQQHETAKALQAFRTYLRLAPKAKDVALIKQRMAALRPSPAGRPRGATR